LIARPGSARGKTAVPELRSKKQNTMKGVPLRARLVLIAAVGAALVALPAGALGSSSRVTTNSQSFADSTGEDANAPDITSIDVTNTDAGLITFHIAISNRPTFTSDMAVLVWLDTDANPATGDPKALGADYVIELDPGAVGLFKWNGTTFDNAPSATTLTFTYDTTGATIHIGVQDLAGTKAINFGADAISGITTDASGNADFTNAHDDLAPDPGHGFFNYSVLTKLTLKQAAFAYTPKPAKSGARLTATLAATESDTSGPVAGATVTCVATIKGVRLRATHSLANGVASCFWKIPKTAKGKTLVGKITITLKGTTLAHGFTTKIR
jgi:hypothetical protein